MTEDVAERGSAVNRERRKPRDGRMLRRELKRDLHWKRLTSKMCLFVRILGLVVKLDWVNFLI